MADPAPDFDSLEMIDPGGEWLLPTVAWPAVGNGVTLAMYGVTDGGNPSLSREHPGIGYYSNVHRDAKGHYWDTGRKADSRYMLPSTNVNAGPTIMPTSPILS